MQHKKLNQEEINASKPLYELIPALIFTYLGLDSIYNLAMWVGVPATTLLNPDVQTKIYNELLEKYPDANLEPMLFLQLKKHAMTFNDERALEIKIELLADHLNEQLTACGHPIIAKTAKPAAFLAEGILAINYLTKPIQELLHKLVTNIGIPWLKFADSYPVSKIMQGITGHDQLKAIRAIINIEEAIYAIKSAVGLVNIMIKDIKYDPRNALGYKGYLQDAITHELEQQKKLDPVNQTPWLWDHSAMKIPTPDVMKHIYKEHIINKEKGIKNFGNYKLH